MPIRPSVGYLTEFHNYVLDIFIPELAAELNDCPEIQFQPRQGTHYQYDKTASIQEFVNRIAPFTNEYKPNKQPKVRWHDVSKLKLNPTAQLITDKNR